MTARLVCKAPVQCECGWILPKVILCNWVLDAKDAGAGVKLECPACRREHVVFALLGALPSSTTAEEP